jgi:osmotically inducible protein OsmC
MAISAALTQAGITANDIETEAILDLDLVGLKIDGIHLDVKASPIEGVSEAKFREVAEGAKSGCIVSKALNVPITLSVTYK